MIAVSGLLVLVAFVTLVVGIFQSGLGLIYVSIGASVLAGISLATGVVKTRPKAVAVGPEPLGAWGATTLSTPEPPSMMEEPPPAPVTSVLSLEEPAETAVVERAEEEAEGPYAAPAPAARATRTTGAAKKSAAAKKAPAKKAASRTAGSVVVIPGRDKYHKDSCRYAKGEATQTITKAAAKKEGYVACGVCKP